jgi:hypothetical protein
MFGRVMPLVHCQFKEFYIAFFFSLLTDINMLFDVLIALQHQDTDQL